LERDLIKVWQGNGETVMSVRAEFFVSEAALVTEVKRLIWETSNHRVHVSVVGGGGRHFKLRRVAAPEGTAEDRIRICFESKFALLLGLAHVHTPNRMVEIELYDVGDEHVADRDINLALLTPACMISYVDVIEPSIFGSNMVKILKTIPVKKRRLQGEGAGGGGLQSYEAKNLDHVPLCQSLIPSIEFKLLQTDGGPVSFSDPTEEVLYNLQFTHVR
jgi:hypothetical protein